MPASWYEDTTNIAYLLASENLETQKMHPPAFRRYSLDVRSLPKNYSTFEPIAESSDFEQTSYLSTEPKYLRSRSSEANFESYRGRMNDIQNDAGDYFSDESFSDPRKVIWRKQGFSPVFETVSSVSPVPESPLESDNNTKLLERSLSLVADDQIIDVEYDSDVGWKTKNVRRNPYKRPSGIESKSHILGADNFPSENLKKSKDFVDPLSDSVKSKMKLSKSKSASDVSEESFENRQEKKSAEASKSKSSFERCRSKSSATSIDSNTELNSNADDEIVDEVFDSSSKKSRSSNKKSLSSLSNCSNALLARKRSAFSEVRSRTSSANVEESTEINAHEPNNNSSNNASPPNIANSPAKSSRDSTKTKKPPSSDYDRDRGRSRHMDAGHRESFKKNDRTNNRASDQDRDASDRERNKGGSLNRSLSNTDPNLEDRIGECT